MTSFRTISLFSVLFFAASSVSAQIYHDPHRKATVGFCIDLETAPDTVIQIVKSVANDTVIRGTATYSKDIEIDDADSPKSSTVLPPPRALPRFFTRSKTESSRLLISPQPAISAPSRFATSSKQ